MPEVCKIVSLPCHVIFILEKLIKSHIIKP